MELETPAGVTRSYDYSTTNERMCQESIPQYVDKKQNNAT